jgi:hypothetical protein
MNAVWVAQHVNDLQEVVLSIHQTEGKAYEAAYNMIKGILDKFMGDFIKDPDAKEMLESYKEQDYRKTVELWNDDLDLITVKCCDVKE